jgi:hypothetical protein
MVRLGGPPPRMRKMTLLPYHRALDQLASLLILSLGATLSIATLCL